MPSPSSFNSFRLDRLELEFERIEERECRRARCLIPASIGIELDQVEIDAALVRSVCLIYEGW